MPHLELYENHEVMNIASEMMRQEYALHELEGGEYDDEMTKKIAQKVILTFMPHIMDFMHERVIVEAPQAHILNTTLAKVAGETLTETDVRPVEGLHVEAKFKHVEFQPTIRREHLEGYCGSLLVEEYDLFAVVRPQYVDPEPDAIVFGDEVMVPFREVSLFRPSEAES